MSRGRKAKTILAGSKWEQIFNKSKGFYFQYIIIQLGRKDGQLSEDNANDLLEITKQKKEKLIAEKKIKKGNSLPKIESEEIPFKVPLNWTWCRFPDVLALANDSIRRGPFGSSITKDMFIPQSDNATKVYEQKNAIYKDFELGSYFIDIEKYPNLKSFLASSGDILISCAGTIGETYLLPENAPLGVINQALLKVRLNNDLIENQYFINFFQTSIKSKVNEDAKGSAMKNLGSIGYLKENLFIPLPPLSEQKLILAFLQDFGKNALDENREYFDSEIENEVVSIHQAQIYNNQISTELNHQLALVKELRQAYLREAMQGKLVPQDSADEPAEILLEKIKAEKEKLVAEKRIRRDKPLPPINAEEIPFEIPSNWAWCRMGETIEFSDNLNIHSKFSNETLINYVDIDAIDNERFQIREVKEKSVSQLSSRARRVLKKGFIVYSLVRPYLNNIAIVEDEKENYIGSTGFAVFNGILVENKFLKFLLLSDYIKKLYLEFISGFNSPSITNEQFQNTIIPLPPLAEQERIVAKLEKLMKFCDELEANIRQGITHADQLLQTALKEALEP